MFYTFECKSCKTSKEVNIPMSDYDKEKDNQYCDNCKQKLTRVLEWTGGVKLCAGCYGVDSSGKTWTN